MESVSLVEITKILGPSAMVAALLTYIFNRRIEKLKMYAKANGDYLASIISGLNEFMGGYKRILDAACEIESKLDAGSLCKTDNDAFSSSCKKYVSSLQTHRIYLVPVLPFGSSNNNAGITEITVISGYLDLWFFNENEVTDEQREDYSKEIRQAVQKLKEKYDVMSERGNNIIKQMNDGKILFTAGNN